MISKDFKLQVGMKVKIRDDLIDGQQYGENHFTNLMESYKGKEVIIKILDYRGSFQVNSNGWWFTLEMIDSIKSTEPDKRYSLEDLSKKYKMFCITNIPKDTSVIFKDEYEEIKKPDSNGNYFHPITGTWFTSDFYYIEYSQLIIEKWKLDEIPTNTYIHNFPSVEKLNELIDFFNKKMQTSRPRYKKFPSEDPTLYISNTSYIDVFHQCPKHTDKTIINYNNIIIEGRKNKKINIHDLKVPWVITNIQNDHQRDKIIDTLDVKDDLPTLYNIGELYFNGQKYEFNQRCDKGWYAQNTPYSFSNFYDYDDIIFDNKPNSKSISIYDLPFPCVITNIDEQGKNKLMRALNLKWNSGLDPEHDGSTIKKLYIYESHRCMYSSSDKYISEKEEKWSVIDFKDLDFSINATIGNPRTGTTVRDQLIGRLNRKQEDRVFTVPKVKTIYIKSKIDTNAPKIVGEYSSAYRKYKPKKGE